ncbi:MAG: transposase [Ardenticatenaceae bacterium]|nr:transposase [Ardenticatenaceae bacterium]
MYSYGIDWGEAQLSLCILNDQGRRLCELDFAPTPAGFGMIEAERIKLGAAPSDCVVAIETSTHLVVDYLLEHDYPVHLISPQATDGYRNRQGSNKAHTDRRDAALLAGILRTDRDSHPRWRPNAPLTQHLAAQLRLVETLRRSIHRQTCQLRAALMRTFPAALEVFSELTTQLALQLLVAYPTAAEASALTQDEFAAFCRTHGDTRPTFIPTRYATLTRPVPSVAPAVAAAYRDTVATLAEVLLPQVRRRQQFIRQLEALLAQHPDAPIFASLPQAGPILAAGLLVKLGDERVRFPTAGAVQALAGTCPVTRWSGKKRVVVFRRGCDREFRHIAHQFARASLTTSSWAKAYWREVRPRCASHAHADRLLANRWLAIIWKLWQTRQPYDEAYHLKQRAQRVCPKS